MPEIAIPHGYYRKRLWSDTAPLRKGSNAIAKLSVNLLNAKIDALSSRYPHSVESLLAKAYGIPMGKERDDVTKSVTILHTTNLCCEIALESSDMVKSLRRLEKIRAVGATGEEMAIILKYVYDGKVDGLVAEIDADRLPIDVARLRKETEGQTTIYDVI